MPAKFVAHGRFLLEVQLVDSAADFSAGMCLARLAELLFHGGSALSCLFGGAEFCWIVIFDAHRDRAFFQKRLIGALNTVVLRSESHLIIFARRRRGLPSEPECMMRLRVFCC